MMYCSMSIDPIVLYLYSEIRYPGFAKYQPRPQNIDRSSVFFIRLEPEPSMEAKHEAMK